MDMLRFPADTIRAQIAGVLTAWGMAPEQVVTTAAVMTHTDLSGIDSHGISMLMSYEELWRSGRLRLDAQPEVVRRTAAMALVDAQGGLGHPAAVAAMELAIGMARAAGVGVVSVRNSHHFGAAGYYAAMAAEAGLIGLVTTSAKVVSVVPTGGALPRLTTNPIAFAAPARRNPPFVLDMSTSTVAANKVKVFDLLGRPVPQGWVTDEAGDPVTDPAAAMAYLHEHLYGGLTPLGGDGATGGHKGYGLAVMVQILSAALSGADLAARRPPGAPEDIGHFLLALDPSVLRPDGGYLDDVDELLDTLRETPPVDAEAPVVVAGDPERRHREERAEHGVPLPGSLLRKLEAVCERARVPFLLDASRSADGGTTTS
ncbi:LDH2 family malate/lactate/ureidoglycolate dehydrogenase [Pseudonocardia alni]|uniref:LDH2 family malate/lactate/ureidoglycolate dehydrogenase n=2 Tax=Pseudonocardiaceae TaxID=2070 RepID=A0AA44URQ5_PSEA5|nr:LDH2 family malate/lactate/ureidoglycolate dehydrogenase [Pseudonocardia alni]